MINTYYTVAFISMIIAIFESFITAAAFDAENDKAFILGLVALAFYILTFLMFRIAKKEEQHQIEEEQRRLKKQNRQILSDFDKLLIEFDYFKYYNNIK